MPLNQTDPEHPEKKGERLDGRDLIQEWVDKHPNSQYVWNKTQFDQIDVEKVDHVIGLLQHSQVRSFAYHKIDMLFCDMSSNRFLFKFLVVFSKDSVFDLLYDYFIFLMFPICKNIGC